MENSKRPSDLPLQLVDPAWGSPLVTTIIELEKLRVKKLGGPVPPFIFFQLKEIFHKFESLGSARIEGNHTTLAEFVEKVIENPTNRTGDQVLQEIYNIEHAIDFIEKNVDKNTVFNRALISEIHKILVDGLTPPPVGEGSRYPGQLRSENVSIKNSALVPPPHFKVPDYFDELLSFVNANLDTQYHLLAIALAHHRMAWIHPFDNGNGRIVRMFTYALLIKQGFQVKSGRILNPTAIFCMDRNKYYDMLGMADSGEKDNILSWCLYMLQGLKDEIEKIDRLLDLEYMVDATLLPVLSYALERQHITKSEFEILRSVVKSKNMSIKSADLKGVIGKESPVHRSRIIKRLKDKKMLVPLKDKGRIYTIGFVNNYLLRGVAHILVQNGFVPDALNKR